MQTIMRTILSIVVLLALIWGAVWLWEKIKDLFLGAVDSIDDLISGRSAKAKGKSRASNMGNLVSSNTVPKQIRPYPMQSGAMNAAIGAVDKCCEFTSFCEKYVIPSGICQPERMKGFIMATPHAISFGFTWKTFYYTLDSLIEEQGYSIRDGGFSFSDNSGMVSYQRQIQKDDAEYEAAYTWMMNTPVEEIISYFERVAENNFTSLGLSSHNASCRCAHSDGSERSFEFTV